MKKVMMAAMLMFMSVLAYAQVSSVPTTDAAAMDSTKQIIDYARAGKWWAASAGFIYMLMFLLNRFKVWDKIGKRWSYVAILVLSPIATILTKYAGGLSWIEAGISLTSGPFMSSMVDLWDHGLMGKDHSLKPMKKARKIKTKDETNTDLEKTPVETPMGKKEV